MRALLALTPAAALAVLAGCVTPPAEPVGRALFLDYCAACHGTEARGDGPAAADLDVSPPDLTRIAARNGGVFPGAQVMSTIDGYTRADQHGGSMPEFGALLEGPMIRYDSGDGRLTPTPKPLVDLAAYLESIQQ